jgi:hypothetical protein
MRDYAGMTPLAAACAFGCLSRSLESKSGAPVPMISTVELILTAMQSNPLYEQALSMADNMGRSPLVHAARRGWIQP